MYCESLLGYTFFKWVGAIVVGIKLFHVANIVIRKIYYRLKSFCGFGFEWKQLGPWAVITGGTDGIGKAYAEELADRGFNICIISRNPEKLMAVANELATNRHIATRTIEADFTGGPEIYQKIEQDLQQLDGQIGVLVNNVGMSYPYSEYFHEVPGGMEFMWNMINTNVTSTTMMMSQVLPKLSDKAVVINVASLMAVYPMPLLATYAACKAYVDFLSKATQYEYKDTGIVIQSVLPGYVATKMSVRRPTLEVPSAAAYVASAIKTVGVEDSTYGYMPHKIRGYVHEWLKANMPERVNMAIALHFMHKNREKKLRKKRLSQDLTSPKNVTLHE